MSHSAPGTSQPGHPRSLRLRPAVIIVTLQWLCWLLVPLVMPEAFAFAVIAGLVGGLALLIWWCVFSRAAWSEKLGVVGLMVAAVSVTQRLVHPSIAGGMSGLMLPIFAVPLLSLALVGWAAGSRRFSTGLRLGTLVGAIVVACGLLTLVRTDGVRGQGTADLHWRWTKTPEDRLLAGEAKPAASSGEKPPRTTAPVASVTSSKWPGFRGAQRDGSVRGVRIATDWSHSSPVELWRRAVGPGWSSFAVDGNFVFTQEQRGEDEMVACYDLATGAPVWSHSDAARFWESNAGAGPRGTPALSGGRVYALGATGILNALDAKTGGVIWTRNATADTGSKLPEWGLASSPLVVGDLVIVATAGVLAAYDAAAGVPRWVGPKSGSGYSSPHLATIAGVEQVLLLNGAGAISVAPADGQLLWSHAWKSDGIVQPAVLADGSVLLGSGSGLAGKVGVRRVAVARGTNGWTTEELWTSNRLKPYFSDFAVHQGHAYGFDGSGLTCIDLAEGNRQWKGGRYGSGQLILLADQDLLLVVSEKGELALVAATPQEFTELARFPALQGKTWNHPVLAGDVLLVRNDREMVALRLKRSPEARVTSR